MKIKVWDGPTRTFHWLLVFSYLTVFFTSRSEWYLPYHVMGGYLALALVIFRIFWGFFGGSYARFSGFVAEPGAVTTFLKSAMRFEPLRYVGHNPAVGWVVLVMLAVTAALTITGILTYSGEEGLGPFAGYVTFETGLYAKLIHTILAYLAVLMVVVHISAALFHDFVLKENIIIAMITGRKEDEEGWKVIYAREKEAPVSGRPAARLVFWIFITFLGALGLFYLPPDKAPSYSAPRLLGAVEDHRESEIWLDECSACHAPFHPTLLPASSWKLMMRELEDHFGDDASLDPEVSVEVLEYLLSASAELSTSEASKHILYSIKKSGANTPLRITEIQYWEDKHSDIAEEVFNRASIVNKSNCIACHPGSDVGSYEDADISVPEK